MNIPPHQEMPFTSICWSCLSCGAHQTCPCFSCWACLCWFHWTWLRGDHWTFLCWSCCICPCWSFWTWLHSIHWAHPCLCWTCPSACDWRSISFSCGSLTSVVLWWLFFLVCWLQHELNCESPWKLWEVGCRSAGNSFDFSSSLRWCHLCLLWWPCLRPPWGGPCRSSCVCAAVDL